MASEFDRYILSIFNQVDRIYSITFVNSAGLEILKHLDPRYNQEPIFTHPKISVSNMFIRQTQQAELFDYDKQDGGENSSLNTLVTIFKTLQLIQIKCSKANLKTGKDDIYYLSILAKKDSNTGFVIALFQNEFIPYILKQL